MRVLEVLQSRVKLVAQATVGLKIAIAWLKNERASLTAVATSRLSLSICRAAAPWSAGPLRPSFGTASNSTLVITGQLNAQFAGSATTGSAWNSPTKRGATDLPTRS